MDFRTIFHKILLSDINGEEKYIKLDQVAYDNFPKSVYRYRTFSERELDALLKNRFYLNFPSNFNDPYDSLPVCLNDRALFDDFFMEEPTAQKEELIKESQDKLKVACFSETITSHLMWAHYADSHKGFALEYDFKKAYVKVTGEGQQKWGNHEQTIKSRDLPAYIYPVVYTTKRIDATLHLKELYRSKYNGIVSIPTLMPKPFDLDYYFRILLTKHKDWAYENEWRVIHPNHSFDTLYVELKPKSIIYGSAISPAHKKVLSYIARENKIKEKQAIIPNDCNKFVIRIVTEK